jgi:hypothetical protein
MYHYHPVPGWRAHSIRALLDYMSELVPEQALSMYGVGIVLPRRKKDTRTRGERYRAYGRWLRANMYPDVGKTGAEERLHFELNQHWKNLSRAGAKQTELRRHIPCKTIVRCGSGPARTLNPAAT